MGGNEQKVLRKPHEVIKVIISVWESLIREGVADLGDEFERIVKEGNLVPLEIDPH